MKVYLGVDLHKRSCWVTAMSPVGEIQGSRRLSTEGSELLAYFGRVEKPAAVAVEATFNWYYFLDVVEPLGLELHLVRHPSKSAKSAYHSSVGCRIQDAGRSCLHSRRS